MAQKPGRRSRAKEAREDLKERENMPINASALRERVDELTLDVIEMSTLRLERSLQVTLLQELNQFEMIVLGTNLSITPLIRREYQVASRNEAGEKLRELSLIHI